MPFTDNVPHFGDNDEVKDSAEVKGGLAEEYHLFCHRQCGVEQMVYIAGEPV